MKFLISFVILYIFLFLIVSCQQSYGPPLLKDFDRSERPQKITVHIFDTEREMRAAKTAFDGTRDKSLLAWAKWSNKESSGCEIFVVKLRGQKDHERLDSWGHELAHCIKGSWHKEGFAG